MAAFRTWWHLLSGTRDPIQVFTDHTNLQYYRHPQKIKWRVTRYINFLEDFNYKLAHIPDACNRADALSRRPDHDDGSNDNDQVVALLDNMFIKAISMAMLDEKLRKRQKNCQPQLEGWKGKYHLRKEDDGTWYKD